MIFDQNQDSLNAWKTQMRVYQKGKRTKKPFGQSVPQISHVTYEQVKAKQCLFNPVLQSYQKREDEIKADKQFQQKRAQSLVHHLKQTLKHEKNYDIVNLHGIESYKQQPQNRKLGPIRNAYNVINNQKLPDYFFKNRDIKLPVDREKKLLATHQKQYNIVSNIYKDHHEEKVNQEIHKQTQQIYQKYWKTHIYDPVYGKFYDQTKEQEFQKLKKEQQLKHGKDIDKKLPPSYVYRQPFISDFTKDLPETLKILDQKNANAKKRYQLKYVILDEYDKRNIEQQIKQQQVLKNKVHFGRVLDQKSKEFDIVTNKPYKESRAEDLYGKKIDIKNWDQLIKNASKSVGPKGFIKTAGFS